MAWLERVSAAIAEIERTPHPASCEEWLEDECTCGIRAALERLWPVIGARGDYGHVDDGHPLQAERARDKPV